MTRLYRGAVPLLWAETLAGATLTLSLSLSECVLDRAEIAAIPPATFEVMEQRFCGGFRCWQRYVVTDGKRKDLGRVCETEQDKSTLERAQ